MTQHLNRRDFVRSTAAASLGLGFAKPFSILTGPTAPADTLVVAIMGVNGRGNALAKSFAHATGVEVGFICDVDERPIAEAVEDVRQIQGKAPAVVHDFRSLLDGDKIDALVIAAPDHWHTPAAVMAMQAGKNVYVEKPCGHNPEEDEIIVAAQKKYGHIVQMGTQQRSARESIDAMHQLHDGIIGRPYFAKCWYANTRGPIGTGKAVPVPSVLDWELWQGPAPRETYRDNVVPYNWHWFWNWGTGEVCNNGTHEIDVCRWALGVDYPLRVTSNGGRYHYDDDWQFYDTQVVSYDFDGDKTITWEGRSCNGLPVWGRGRGSIIYATEGSLLIDREGYTFFDLDNKEIKTVSADNGVDALNTVGGDVMTDLHTQNFVDTVHGKATLNQPIENGAKTVLLCHLGNIAQRVGRSLQIDPGTGHIKGDPEANTLWSREYAPGWRPAV